MTYDFLIVGAGFSGCVLAERIASQLGKTVLLVEKRNHLGGNAYDYYDDHGIIVHKYGPHIFHTNSKEVWDYLSRFTKWRQYSHHVLAVVEDKKIPVPFNLNSLYILFPRNQAEKLESELIERFGFGAKVPILELKKLASGELTFLANYIYKNVFYGYTVKQWGLEPEQLSPSVTARVPVFVSRDDRYFQDTYQALPKHGYTELFRRIVDHSKIELLLSTDYRDVIDAVKFDRMAFTGPIDEFFDYTHGELLYRSLKFDFEYHPKERFQEVGTVNYPNQHSFTRITEFKHLTGQESVGTVTVTEYPQRYENGANIPYYPVPSDLSEDILRGYKHEIEKLNGTVVFFGRLADYRYYNMDQVVARGLAVFEKEICKEYV